MFFPLPPSTQRNPEYDDVMWFWGMPRRKAVELIVVISWTIFFSVLSLVLLLALGACATTTIEFAQVQGVMNSVLTVFQWWPQLLLTMLLKEQGSLSMPMLITIQVG